MNANRVLRWGVAALTGSLLACATGGAGGGGSALHAAAAAGDLMAIQAAVASGAELNASNARGETPLHLAANAGHAEAVGALLDAGADPNAQEFDGDAPLHNAAVLGHAAVVQRLLASGADPTMLSSQGMTPAQHARRGKGSHLLTELNAAEHTWRMAKRLPSTPAEADRDRNGKAGPRVYGAGYKRRIAAVIGIDQYSSWPPLGGAVRDARRTADTLRAAGFDEVLELYDGDATRSRILKLLGDELPGRANAEDLVVIFFAGHGQTETLHGGEKVGYVIPVDGKAGGSFATAISMSRLRDLANRIPAKHVYYVMDSCYSGLFFTRGISLAKSNESPSRYMDKVTRKRAVQMIAAGQEGEEAIERDGQGLFTGYFLRALQGEADFNGDGLVTSGEIAVFVGPRVTNASDAAQTPQAGVLEGSGEIVFSVPR